MPKYKYNVDEGVEAIIDVLDALAILAIENKHGEELRRSTRGLQIISHRADLILRLLDASKPRQYPRLVQ